MPPVKRERVGILSAYKKVGGKLVALAPEVGVLESELLSRKEETPKKPSYKANLLQFISVVDSVTARAPSSIDAKSPRRFSPDKAF
jgi:hypothetical protein